MANSANSIDMLRPAKLWITAGLDMADVAGSCATPVCKGCGWGWSRCYACQTDKQRFLDGLDPGAHVLCVRRAVSDSNAAGHGAVPAALECKNHSRGPARPSALINPTHVRRHSVVVSTSSAVLSGKVNLWVHNALESKSVYLLEACVMRRGHLPCDVSVHRCGRRFFPRHTVRSELFACAHCGSCPRVE
jgi:hypothetical protein